MVCFLFRDAVLILTDCCTIRLLQFLLQPYVLLRYLFTDLEEMVVVKLRSLFTLPLFLLITWLLLSLFLALS